MSRGGYAVVATLLLALTATPAGADTIFEVESARANARAGGPTNEHDRELLDRWGRLSGTPDAAEGHDRDTRTGQPPRYLSREEQRQEGR